jgi:hypothetical protein
MRQVRQGRRFLQGVAHHGHFAPGRARRQVFHDAHAGRIVQVDHGGFQARPVEQLQLGRFISCHAAVVVQVVARQVGKQRRVEMHAVRAAQVQCNRRDFDGQRLRARVAALRQLLRQQHGVRRGVAGRVECRFAPRIELAHAQGADNKGLAAQAAHGLAEPHGARCLAVGARHAHRVHGGIGLAVERVGDRAGLAFQVLHFQVRHLPWRVPLRVPLRAFGFQQYGGGALRNRGGNVVAAILAIARIGEEDVARGHAARVRNQLSGRSGLFDPVNDVLHYMASGPLSAGTTISVTFESGGTFLERSALAATAANVGAATWPP